MATLLLDVGNSRVKWARVRSGLYEFSGSMPLTGLSVDSFLQQLCPDANKPVLVIMSMVGDNEWARMLRFSIAHTWGTRLLEVVAEAKRDGLKNGYAQPQRLGSDRWSALLGAWRMQSEAVCVVDAGTALTMDVVNNDGEHLGGLIVPGLSMMRQCLSRGTAKVGSLMTEDQAADAPTVGLLGRNTDQAVAGGALWTLAAGVERLRAQAYDLVGGSMRCVITGGDAQQLLPLLSGDWEWNSDLVLRGLLSYAGEYK
jgi:type III pantothenate kinase